MPVSILVQGLLLGLSAGLAPGPLTVLVVSNSIRFGMTEGLKAALAPVLTDAPVILLSVLLVGRTAGSREALGVIALLGAAVLVWLGYESLTARPIEVQSTSTTGTLGRAMAVNLLNPHPWLFWLTVGGPILVETGKTGYASPALFLTGFYAMLVGAKVALALLAARFRNLFQLSAMVWINRMLGLMLILLAIGFAQTGLERLGLWTK